MHLYVANDLLYAGFPSDEVVQAVDLPAGLTYRARRPSFALQRRGTVINGKYFTPGLFWRDDVQRAWRLGIAAGTPAPVLTTQGTGLTAVVIGYYSFVHKIGSTVIHQGNLSSASNSLTLSNQGIRWTNIPTSAPDPRVTHVRLWRSVDGSDPQVVTDVALGTSTYDEAVAFGSLGELPPVFSDGSLNLLGRGVPNYCTMCISYHRRVWYAGDPRYPSRIWYSLIDEPESVGPSAYVETRDREAVTALGLVNDQLMVGCFRAMYDIQGYSSGPTADINIRKLTNAVGANSHFGMVNIGKKLFWTWHDGVWMYDSQFHKVSEALETQWIREYKTNKDGYDDVTVIDDQDWRCLRILIPGALGSTGSRYYVGSYQDLLEGKSDQLYWLYDRRDRVDRSVGHVYHPTRGRLHLVGGTDGIIRQENDSTDVSDMGDSYNMALTIQPKHQFHGDQSGGQQRGLALKELSLYIISPLVAYTVKGYAGPASAKAQQSAPNWQATVPAQALATTVEDDGQYFRPTGMAGKGYTIVIQQSLPDDFEFRGWSPSAAAGPHSRGKTA